MEPGSGGAGGSIPLLVPRRKGLVTVERGSDGCHPVLADVVITPRLGPSEWRDFDVADLF